MIPFFLFRKADVVIGGGVGLVCWVGWGGVGVQ